MKTAVTIISKNYISFARVLAESFRQHHPDWDFKIVLVDETEGYVKTGVQGPKGREYELLEMRSFGLPDYGTLIYRYTIMELNTAVKPFVLDHLLHARGYEAVAYIDPDILFLDRFTKVEAALETGELCLIPHMRRPFYDDKHPSDVSILQSGTYNLGFCAMRRTPAVKDLLGWWMGKLYLDCIVDIPNGLFVDQKWMDMAPGFVPGTVVLDDPGYNAAYWNLHEREIRRAEDGTWTADGAPLVFFHFSGYSPYVPGRLSKHQDRHDLAHLPDLRALFDLYGDRLLKDGYAETGTWPYAYAKLPNGVKLPLELVRDIVQDLLRRKVPVPDPLEKPDAFCAFLMRPNAIPHLPRLSAFQHYLLQRRGDLAMAFPNAANDPEDPDFWRWVGHAGVKEEGVGDLVAAVPNRRARVSLVKAAYDELRARGRQDVFDAYPRPWSSDADLQGLAYWTGHHAPQEDMRLDPATPAAIRGAGHGPAAGLHLYFMRADLQRSFPDLESPQTADRFEAWLLQNRLSFDLTIEQIALFREFLRAEPTRVAQMRYLYQTGGETDWELPTLAEAAPRLDAIGGGLTFASVANWIAETESVHVLPHVVGSAEPPEAAKEILDSGSIWQAVLKPKSHFRLRTRALAEAASVAEEDWINFAGHLASRTGMGESARSNLTLLRRLDDPVAVRAFPVADAREAVRADGLQFGQHRRHARRSLTVANADSLMSVRRLLPADYWGGHRIGYWVWETEELPRRFARSADWYDEIWTPSAYSADAIRAVTDKPVHVVPHVVDLPAIDAAKADRARWGLPKNAVLYGFMFDPKSVLERKNVAGLIEAFLDAVRPSDNAMLVLKSNDRGGGSLEYERIKAYARAHPNRIAFLETFLTRADTLAFMKSLDVYVSLHRSEGFGLTCAEAMALGMPVIASGYSGNLDFMTPETSRLVETRTVTTTRAHGPYQPGSRWGDPDHDDAVAAIREMLDRRTRARVGQAASKAIRSTLSVDRVAGIMRDLLGASG